MLTTHKSITSFAPELGITGLTLRNWREESDYEKMLRVLYADKHAQGLEEAIAMADFKAELQSRTGADLQRGVFLLERDGHVIAYKDVRAFPEVNGCYCYSHHGYVLPEWKRRGLGRALIRHSEQVLRDMAAMHPADAPKFFQVFAQSIQTASIHLFEEEGYSPVRYFYEMVRPQLDDIPEIALPAGIEARPVRPEQYRSIWDALVEGFKEHWGEAEHGEQDYVRWLQRPFFQPELWHVAWAGDRVVAMVLNFIDEPNNAAYHRKRGQTDDIATLKEFRGRGIARALIARGLKQFRSLGMTEAELAVDTENGTGALRLYETLGYRPTKTFIVYRKELGAADERRLDF